MKDVSFPHAIIDDFLPAHIAAGLLDQMLAAEQHFTPSLVGGPDHVASVSDLRSSLRLPGRVGVDLAPFRAAIAAQAVPLCAAVGIQPFPVHHTECSIVAHGDGHFYRTHVDTRTGREGPQAKHFRLLSCVYYLYREPKGFSGGTLHIHRLGARDGAASGVTVGPVHNRLVVFPAFIPHEVRDIACPSGQFADSRFSINCWLHRERREIST